MRGHKKRYKARYPHFLSFCPKCLIFSGNVSEGHKFLQECRNFETKPANVNFSQKCEISKIVKFRGLTSKIVCHKSRCLRWLDDFLKRVSKVSCATSEHIFMQIRNELTNVDQNSNFWNMAYIQNFNSPQNEVFRVKWKSQRVWSPRRSSCQNFEIIFF